MLARASRCAASLALMSRCAMAQVAPAQIFGQGLHYCYEWTTEPATDFGYKSWILGYWSGLDEMNNVNHFVGRHNSGSDIWARVKAKCVIEPGKGLGWATFEAYKEMQLREW